MLRAFAELVRNVVSTFQMKHKPLLRDWHTDQAHVSLPRTKSDTQQQEQLAVPQDSPIALMVSSTRSVRPSNHEGVLTNRATPTTSFSGMSRESGWLNPGIASSLFRSSR